MSFATPKRSIHIASPFPQEPSQLPPAGLRNNRPNRLVTRSETAAGAVHAGRLRIAEHADARELMWSTARSATVVDRGVALLLQTRTRRMRSRNQCRGTNSKTGETSSRTSHFQTTLSARNHLTGRADFNGCQFLRCERGQQRNPAHRLSQQTPGSHCE